MDNYRYWTPSQTPPPEALKPITGGRLQGMTDIKPQWRFEKATELFGPCGIGWWYTVDRLWTEQGANSEVLAFATISLYYKDGDTVSQPIPGSGGSTLIAKEKNGMYNSDEAYKMAITDALSVAFKMLGFGADIYMGKGNSGSKYDKRPAPAKPAPVELPEMSEDVKNKLRTAGCTKVSEVQRILAAFDGDVVAMEKAGEFFGWDTGEMIKAQEVSA